MAKGTIYLRPVGRLDAYAAGAFPGGLAVAGREDHPFTMVELIERGLGGTSRSLIDADRLASLPPNAHGLLARISTPRPHLAGLALDRPRIMGVVNVTPDSFSDGGRYLTSEAAIEQGLRLAGEGADIIDVGGESTRPRAAAVDVTEECRRVLPVIAELARRSSARLSIDTRNAEVMRRAAQEGAHIINDVSALTHDPASLAVVAGLGLPVVLMHAQGDPATMQDDPCYDDVVLDVYDALEARIAACEKAGIARGRIVVDPGIGFGKTLAHNLALLGQLGILHGLGCAVMLGASRKSFIGKLTGAETSERLPGSLAAALLAVGQGVQLLRVHDVAATRQALAVLEGALAPRAFED